MKKEILYNLLIILFVIVVISNVAYPSNNSSKKIIIPQGIQTFWYNSGIKETVWIFPEEIAIFLNKKTKISKEKIHKIAKLFDQEGILLKGSNKFVIFTQNKSSKKFSELANIKKQNPEIEEISPIFYEGGVKDSSKRMALTGEVIIHFHPGWDLNRINSFISRYNLIYLEKLDLSPDTYLFKAQSALESLEVANEIQESDEVIYAYPNWLKSMSKKSIPNDPLFNKQWHLYNFGQGNGKAGEDINIIKVWDSYKGSENEIVAIVDDGLETGHEDLFENILFDYQWDWVDNDNDPNPATIEDNHGTSVAGIVAGRGFNGIGICGVAPNAKLIGYRLLGATTDLNIASALTKNKDIIDISNNSWGPFDPTLSVPYVNLSKPSPLIENAIKDGIINGRNGKGIIYVFAAGNGGEFNDNSNYNGYANSRYTIAVASTTNFGKRAAYSERGSNIFINAPSNYGTLSITTTDRSGDLGYSHENYTDKFGGTSASTAIVSGVTALLLQANPELSWRDVQHILLNSATKNDPEDEEWTINSAGYNINLKYGFGRINASDAINLAKNWISVPDEIIIEMAGSPNIPIPDDNITGVSHTITIPYDVTVEYVDIFFTSNDHTYWGDLEITLTSPSGTESILSEKQNAIILGSYNNWKFGSIRHFGESSLGRWTLKVKDLAPFDIGTFQSWKIKIYGIMYPDKCSPSIYISNSTIYIPVIKFLENYFWAIIKYEENGFFRLIDFGLIIDNSLFNQCRTSEIIKQDNNFNLILYNAHFNSKPFVIDTHTYWGIFEYMPTKDGQIWFRLLNVGRNQ